LVMVPDTMRISEIADNLGTSADIAWVTVIKIKNNELNTIDSLFISISP
jgi:hypothetical protein